jgi:hypothetical protein
MMTVNVGAGQVARTGGRRGTPRAAAARHGQPRRRDSSHVLAGIRVRGLDGLPVWRCGRPCLPAADRTEWIAPDGKSFWLTWTDFQEGADGTGARQAPGPAGDGASDGEIRRLPAPRPYYAFNVQRVDLAVA